MNEQTPVVTPPSSEPAAVSLESLSLAEYRAHREKPVEAPLLKAQDDQQAVFARAITEPKTAPAAEEEAEQTESTVGGNAGESDAEETDAAEESTEQHAEPAKKKGGFQRKIEAKEREIEQLRAQLAAQAAGKPQETAPAEPTPAAKFDKPKPKLENAESIDAHIEALSEWKAEERAFRESEAKRQADAQAELKRLGDSWSAQENAARKQHADYDTVIRSASHVGLSPAHQRIIVESEAGAAIAYELASNLDELKKFAALPALKAAAFIGRLEAARAAKTAPAPKTETPVSKAPKPISPVGARNAAGAAAQKAVSDMSLAEYRKFRGR